MTTSGQTNIDDLIDTKNQSQLDQELYNLMRATGRSRVQVLNAIKVRGPSRDAVMRALGAK
jgi:hypothetical protein